MDLKTIGNWQDHRAMVEVQQKGHTHSDDLSHNLLHIQKALGPVAALAEHLEEGEQPSHVEDKRLADLVIHAIWTVRCAGKDPAALVEARIRSFNDGYLPSTPAESLPLLEGRIGAGLDQKAMDESLHRLFAQAAERKRVVLDVSLVGELPNLTLRATTAILPVRLVASESKECFTNCQDLKDATGMVFPFPRLHDLSCPRRLG